MVTSPQHFGLLSNRHALDTRYIIKGADPDAFPLPDARPLVLTHIRLQILLPNHLRLKWYGLPPQNRCLLSSYPPLNCSGRQVSPFPSSQTSIPSSPPSGLQGSGLFFPCLPVRKTLTSGFLRNPSLCPPALWKVFFPLFVVDFFTQTKLSP